MKVLTWPKQRWQFLLDIQIIIAILFYLLVGITRSPYNFFTAGILLVILFLNRYQQEQRYLKYVNIILIPRPFCKVWVYAGNYLLGHFNKLSILIILLWWLIWLVLLLPLVMTSVSEVHNWILRLITFNIFLDVQYGPDAELKIRNLPLMHTFNYQGVISAFALIILVCFMVHSWGYRFNPNLKFLCSKNFKWSVFVSLLVLLVINIWWVCFGGLGNNLFQVLFSFSIDFERKYFTWPNFTAALEPGILEEAERYANIMILLIAFQNLRKWRIPIAVYGSTLIFALSHLSNVGLYGQNLMATISQVIAVTDAMVWAIAYLYTGKLWLPMIVHFLTDYLLNLEEGWASGGSWSGDFNDWATTFIPLVFGLAVTLWMMFAQRRQVMEENVDRLLSKNFQEDNYKNFTQLS